MITPPPVAFPAAQLREIEASHAVPTRAYHNFRHVGAVLEHYQAITDGPGWSQPDEVHLAVLYHDAIHVAGRRDNEARSAKYAIARIAYWLPDAGIDAPRVAALIELTARHGTLSPGDLGIGPKADDARHFLDCDMAILGAERAEFDAYHHGVAEEYRGTLPGWLFKLNRQRFLNRLLGSKRIFLSDFFHQRFDAQARANLRRALDAKR